MKPWYAINARDLLETRKQGMQPEGPVHVAMDGGNFDGTALYLRPDMPLDRMDWRMLVNLEVWLWATPAVPLERVLDTALRIAHVKPSRLILRFDDGEQVHDIDIGSGTHRGPVADIPAEHSFLWAPMRLSWTRLGNLLQKSLRNKNGMWSYSA